jgi:hypothetical protein
MVGLPEIARTNPAHRAVWHCFCLGAFLACAVTKIAAAGEPISEVSWIAPSGKEIEGKPLPIWIQRYWQWTRSFPARNTPVDDNTGSKCGIRQNQPVFFLTGGAHAGPISRKCTIPKDKYILIPVIISLAQEDKPGNVSCDALLRAARDANETATDLSMTINGQAINPKAIQKQESGCFNLNDLSSGISGKAAGTGYWVILNRMRPGTYQLHFSGKYLVDGFSQDVTYQVQVE